MSWSKWEVSRAMAAAGFTRQWRYRRDWQEARLRAAEENDLRWCILCGGALGDLRMGALFCSPSCREGARQKRRKRGVRPGAIRRYPIRIGENYDWGELWAARVEAFWLCHGREIARPARKRRRRKPRGRGNGGA